MRRLFLPVLLILFTFTFGSWGDLVSADTNQTDAINRVPTTAQPSSTDVLAVTDVLPKPNSSGVEPTALITVIFNRPVVALTTTEAMAALPAPITISPAVNGSGEWLNTSIYVFRPEPALDGGVPYTVTVNPDLSAVDGSVLGSPFAWSFTSAPPQIVTVLPEDLSSAVRLNPTVQIAFNQPMDRASTEATFFLRGRNSGSSVAGTFEWAEDSTGFGFTPEGLLRLDTIYDYGFSGPVLTASGGSSLSEQPIYSFATVPAPTVVGSDPLDGNEAVSPYGSVVLFFASPMNMKTLADKLTIEPEPWREPDLYFNEYDNSYYISFPTEPSTDYTVTLAAGAEDIYGNAIERPFVIQYRTTAWDPDYALQVPGGEVGFYNARNTETQLYLTHLNVSQLDFQLYRLGIDRLARALGQYSYNPTGAMTPNPNELVRSWQQPVANELNVRRYELLNLGDSIGGAVTCPGAPESRLKVGDTAVVITDPDPVRARASAPDGEVVGQLYRDYALPIIGGPICANDILWWQVRLRDEQTAWVAEGTSEEYFLDVRLAAQTSSVVVSDGGALQPGVYWLQTSTPETSARNQNPFNHIMVVGTANLTMKYGIDRVLIWATDVQTGAPIPNAPITVYDRDYAALGSGSTDADGLLQLPIPRQVDLYQPLFAVLQSDSQFGLGFTEWSSGIEGYEFGQFTNYSPQPYNIYLYTDRPIYRPGQPVYFRGVARLQNDVRYTQPDFSSIPINIYDGNGEVIQQQTLDVTPYGTFNGQFDLADDGALGYYRIEAVLPTSNEQNSYYNPSIGFNVAEYRLPEFQVNLTAQATDIVQGETIQVTLDSRYFFGGVVSNATVEWSAIANPYYFQWDGPGYYDFQDINYDGGPGEFRGSGAGPLASGTGTTDAEGKLTIELPAALEDATQSLTYTIEAVVTDESDQVVAGRTEVIVHKGLIYIGAVPAEYVGQAGQESVIDLIATDWQSRTVANQAIEVEVVERRWSSVQEQDELGRTTWTWEVEDIPVTTGSATTGANGAATFTFTPPLPGIYKATIRTRDSQGNAIVASTTMWVSGSEYVAWRQQNSNRIDLIADKRDYAVGDTAEILIASPFQGTTEALVTVERGGVLQAEHLTLEANSTVYRLPITEDMAPNVYVSILLIKGVDDTNPVAAFRMGMANLNVDPARKELNISITPDTDEAGPGDTVTYTVQTTDYAGNPVQAEVGVGLTDLASLSLADPNSGPILTNFYGQQGLGIRTSTALTINVDQITQQVLDTIKGGGGGGGELGIFDIRQEFVDTAYWNGALVTDANGVATFTVTLPDNLTTWRLDARAVTAGADGNLLVGQDTFDLLSTKPLLIRPVTPRFLVVGDQLTLAAVVNNNTGEGMIVDARLDASGVRVTSDMLQRVEVPSGGRARLEWSVTVEDVNAADLTFFARGIDEDGDEEAYTDASKPPLGQGDDRLIPIYNYEVPETVGTAGLLTEGGSLTEAISLPGNVTGGELDIEIDFSMAAAAISGLDYLEAFAHDCAEQTVSKFLPNVITYRALDQLDLTDETLKAQLERNVNRGLQRLNATQRADGGWGWFVQDSSNPLTTAYALVGLIEAQASGFTIPAESIRRAQAFLQSTFVVPGANVEAWRLNRQAFVLYALARAGAPDVARTATLFESRDRLTLDAKAFLAMTFALATPADGSRSDVLISDLINAATLSATGVHWQETGRDYYNWNTDTRTTALALMALIKLDGDNALLPNVVRYLMTMRQADAWATTQETAWSVMALTDWMVTTGELQPGYTFSAAINGSALTTGEATPATVRDSRALTVDVADLLRDQANQLVIERSDGPGVLYYTAHLQADLPVPEIQPLNRGIIVERRYTIGDSTVTQAQVGDLIDVRVTIIAPTDLHYVVIEDPIPAGTEAINPNLNTEQQIGTRPEINAADPLSQGWGWWWFSNIEFRDEAVRLYATYLPAGTYEFKYSLRAGLAGTYNVIPTQGYEFYFPEVSGRGAGSQFTVLGSQSQ
ncbi:MAG TPA: Ig-like domain-containing protein [Aggregatilineales bacterium]|nr:Ig-like domain-containing protein [Aggregatilineales bacterium]